MKTLVTLLLFISLHCQAYTVFHGSDNQPYTWNKTLTNIGYIPWEIQGDAPPILRESILYATQTWAAASNNALRFKEGTGGIVVSWSSDLDYFLGYTVLSLSGSDIVSSTTRLNSAQYAWHRDPLDDGATIHGRANLDSVMLHEFGHALGLDHVDGNMSGIIGEWDETNLPTMYSTLLSGASTLHEDDVAGILFLYPFGTVEMPIVYRVSAMPAKHGRFLIFRRKVRFETEPFSDAVWDFGDGSLLAQGVNVLHVYQRPGEYFVRATIGDRTVERVIVIFKRRPAKRDLITTYNTLDD